MLIINPEFQFHKGTIRTVISITSFLLFANFNSIKVQLEPFSRDILTSPVKTFQFHKGTIRTVSKSKNEALLYNFNSIKVQLERKGGKGYRIYHKFQFHKGTIRT